jgi:hypothetical protein
MADKKKAGSKLLAALGRTKKQQMDKLIPKGAKVKSYPKVKGDVRGKGPYLRGKVMGAGDLISRRAVISGVDATKALRKADKAALRDTAVIGAAAAAGFGVGKYGKSKKAKSHQQKAKRMADEAIKKQKAKKEKHHSK